MNIYLTTTVSANDLINVIMNAVEHQHTDDIQISFNIDERFVEVTTKHLSDDGWYADCLCLITES